ncbi:MAG: GspH/FimT family pseudopilin [Deltaproteobacteria bacterium]|nr:GspH/FimT family pseudopilin [Deltaproteobacteria bacterium]
MINILEKIASKSTAEKGFTLVELMVVVAITAIIAGFTVAEINSTSYQLKSAAQTLKAKMQQARLLAIKEDCNVYVDFDIDGNGTVNSSYALWRDGNNDSNYDDPAELIETVTLPNNISFGAVSSSKGGPNSSPSPTSTTSPPTDGISYGGDRLCFDPRGTSSNGWAFLTTSNDSAGTYAVGTNNVGRIQLQRYVTSGGEWR